MFGQIMLSIAQPAVPLLQVLELCNVRLRRLSIAQVARGISAGEALLLELQVRKDQKHLTIRCIHVAYGQAV